ncbi:SDR family oxidoreductase [Tsukamurella sp. 8F]|uniref:SDR family oxidoreductase n=1 Tax=unclassified Tsukamurella TaxID=2633480 RepID=UPI0023B99C73|nr:MULTISPECIES: SDR family oxidoreductase [unclassified Tsukamurella]MDF0528375.1 SDR family oxidoreductase [Tsukamurella sp. 8J]MDF0586200.1 SDR family oxidoreductase [Tsukamurella sp. 8F]
MALSIDMSGRVVLVTGGRGGVGSGIAEAFRAAGGTLETAGRSKPDGRDAEGLHYSRIDVREPDSAAAWIADVMDRRGRIDIVVNNAGGGPYAEFATASPRLHQKVTALNFLGPVYVAQAAHAALVESGGVLLNVTSISARRPSPGTAVYGAAKAALESLTTSLAVEWAPRVRVNAVSCGLVATSAAAGHYGDAEQTARVAATVPRGVFASPREIGDACVLLASPLAANVTGAVLNADGGGEWPAFLRHTPNA